jgi:hypothetical protein
MDSRGPGFHAAKRRVAALIKTATARLADPALPPKVLWSNFQSMSFCDPSDFSSLRLAPTILLIFFVICLPLRL